VLRGKTTTFPPTDTCNALTRPAALLTHQQIEISNEHQAAADLAKEKSTAMQNC
jgi:hypothetical protein